MGKTPWRCTWDLKLTCTVDFVSRWKSVGNFALRPLYSLRIRRLRIGGMGSTFCLYMRTEKKLSALIGNWTLIVCALPSNFTKQRWKKGGLRCMKRQVTRFEQFIVAVTFMMCPGWGVLHFYILNRTSRRFHTLKGQRPPPSRCNEVCSKFISIFPYHYTLCKTFDCR